MSGNCTGMGRSPSWCSGSSWSSSRSQKRWGNYIWVIDDGRVLERSLTLLVRIVCHYVDVSSCLKHDVILVASIVESFEAWCASVGCATNLVSDIVRESILSCVGFPAEHGAASHNFRFACYFFKGVVRAIDSIIAGPDCLGTSCEDDSYLCELLTVGLSIVETLKVKVYWKSIYAWCCVLSGGERYLN